MRTLRLMGAAALIWAAGTFAALAADLGGPSKSIFDDGPAIAKQTGTAVYFGVHGGKSLATTDVTIDGEPVSLDGVGMNGWIGGVHTGVDVALGKGELHPFAGVFAGYSNTEFALTLGSDTFSGKRRMHAFDHQETGMAVCLTGDLGAGIAAPI